jgi:hypothetical protein
MQRHRVPRPRGDKTALARLRARAAYMWALANADSGRASGQEHPGRRARAGRPGTCRPGRADTARRRRGGQARSRAKGGTR